MDNQDLKSVTLEPESEIDVLSCHDVAMSSIYCLTEAAVPLRALC